MPDTSFDPFLVPFNSLMDYDEPFSDSRRMKGPSVTHSRHPHEHASLESMMRPDRSVTSSWSMHGVASGGAGSAYSTAISDKRVQPTADPTSTALRSQLVSVQGSFIFPEGFSEETDFGAFHMDQSSPLSPFTRMNASAASSTASNSESLFTRDVDCSSSGASSVLTNLSYARSQPAIISGCRQDSLEETETACKNSGQSCLFSALEVLQCSCMSFSQVQLVLVIICDKLIAWYRAVLQDFPDDRQDACTNADTQASDEDNTLNTPASMASERALHQCFAVGEYSFDARLESKIRGLVIASELQQLETVFAKLDDCLQKVDFREVDPIPRRKKIQSTLTIDSPGLSKAVHTRLIAHLHKQLQGIKAEISMEK